MMRFHFHLWDGKVLIPDSEGVDLKDDGAARIKAMLIARELLAEEVREGRLPLGMRLDVEDEEEHMVHQLDFKDAVKILH